MVILTFWILFGMVTGWIATLMDTPSTHRILYKNALLGIAGSMIGGTVGRSLEHGDAYGIGPVSMLLAIAGSAAAILAGKGTKHRTD